MSELNIDLDKLEDQARKGYMADARFLAFVSPATILDLIQLARCAPILTPRQAIPRVTLDDARIIEALNARGIDTYPSKYGFDTVQVSATSVSTLREVIQDLAPVSTPQQSAQRASVATAKFWALLEAVCNAWLELDSSFEGGEATFAAADKLKEAQSVLIAHINAWGSAGSGATDGWISVNERLPARCEEVFVWPCPSDYCMTAEMWSLEPAPGVKWVHNEYVTGYGNEKVTMHRAPTHWRPIFAAPSPAPQGEQA